MNLDAKAGQKSPFNLIPTSLKGVYSFVPPPKGTDLTKASRATLLRHGIFARRPDPDKEPDLFALWHQFVTEIWTEENFTPPVFEVSKDTPHSVKRPPDQPEGNYDSYGWSGVVVVGKWIGAMGTWTIPKVSVPTTPVGGSGVWQSSSWVGLDGAAGLIPGTKTTDVLQTGISQNVVPADPKKRTRAYEEYYAWYEWVVPDLSVSAEFPYVYPVIIKSPAVKPGDAVSAIVQYVNQLGDVAANPRPGPGPYKYGGVVLTNLTTNKVLCNIALKPPTGASLSGESAEWIMEAPDGFEKGTLPSFTSVNFRNAGACDANDAPPGANAGVELQKADTCTFKDFQGNVETNISASLATVNINYQNP